jgi:flavodoxin
MGVLVVYYSMSGNTARVARDLAKRMHADLESLRDTTHGLGAFGYLKAGWNAMRGRPAKLGPVSHSPTSYDLTIIGTPVWAWQMTPAIRAYLQRFGKQLGHVAFFVTSGDTDVARILPAMEALAGRKAVAAAGFNAAELADAGMYEKKLVGFVEALNSCFAPVS